LIGERASQRGTSEERSERGDERSREEQDRSVSEGPVRLTALVSGRVQGVGFRWWTRCRALELGLVGQAENLADGRVRVEAEGPRQGCERLVELLRGDRAPGSVDNVETCYGPAEGGWTGFVER
jgi:acylphosphatase